MNNYQDIIKNLIKETTYLVSNDCEYLLKTKQDSETNEAAKLMLETINNNIETAREKKQPLCQSPGYATFYISFGEDFFIPEIEELIKKAIVEITSEGFCRPSIVDPLTRHNNGDNSGYRAPNIEFEFVKGQKYVQILPSFKGCGIEVFNRMKVFTLPEMGENFEGIKKFVLDCVCEGAGKPCLPFALGIGIGGQVDVAAKLSRKAVSTRSWLERNPENYIAELENELLEEINLLNIGSGGIGGNITALAVNIETAATHTAICPVVVNFHCWVARRKGIRIYPDGQVEDIDFMGNFEPALA